MQPGGHYINHGSQGELSVTRKALVLRVASGELAKHRPILDFGGAQRCMLCMISMFTLYDMIYVFSHISLSLLSEISYVDGLLLSLMLVGCFCVYLYIYIL